MRRYLNLALAILCGLLLWASWPVSPLSFLVFIAFLPLLWLETRVKSRKKFFWLVYLSMFTWNIATTWWIWNASAIGAIAAFFANSFIMCLPWLGFRIAKKRLGEAWGYISLIAFWMCFEYVHLQDWGLSWPWLTLGNVFATHPEWVKWYSITGTSGGTFWVLGSNVLVYSVIREFQKQGRTKKYFIRLASWFLVLILPILGSSIRKKTTSNQQQVTSNIVVVQPNIDAYAKISEFAGSFDAQLQILIQTAEKQVDSNTAMVIWPETALYMFNGIDEETLKENYFMTPLWDFLKHHPKLSLFTGIESFRRIPHKTPYSQEFNGIFVESYNGAALLDSSGSSAFYHKSMLVPGVETLPWFLKFMSPLFEKFGGTTAGYAKQDTREVIREKHGYAIAPAICYESIYGEYMSRYVRKGANLICIITNDGWWQNTPGHKQHNAYARLRAIETGCWVCRSANTGISCFVSPEGEVLQPQPYDTRASIKLDIGLSDPGQTFFVRHGDWLSKIMVSFSSILILITLYLKFFSKKKQRFYEKSKSR
jgi:apolipoprotein N-acyltransferase